MAVSFFLSLFNQFLSLFLLRNFENWGCVEDPKDRNVCDQDEGEELLPERGLHLGELCLFITLIQI